MISAALIFNSFCVTFSLTFFIYIHMYTIYKIDFSLPTTSLLNSYLSNNFSVIFISFLNVFFFFDFIICKFNTLLFEHSIFCTLHSMYNLLYSFHSAYFFAYIYFCWNRKLYILVDHKKFWKIIESDGNFGFNDYV